MTLGPILLETWMRLYYFAVDADIGSSGVQSFSFAELRALTGLNHDDLDNILLRDSESLGGAGVRRALAERWLGGAAERVLVTHGSSEAIYLIMTTLLAAGDKVVVLEPCYPQHFSVAEALGCRIERWPLRFENGFRPDMSEARKIIAPGTRMVVVNFPNNPTGATLTVDEQKELLRLVEAAGAYLLWDGAFAELTYDQPPLPDPVTMSERVLSIGTLSKAYGLPGLRVGWCLAAPELLQRLVQTRDHMTLHLSPLVELVAERAIEHGDKIVAVRREQARHNLAILARWLEEAADLIDWVPPAGGVCTFISFRRPCAVDELCHHLARKLKVLLIPGSCFGHPAHARLGFGDATESLCLGLSRFSQLLATLHPPMQGAVAASDCPSNIVD